jgi:hypothetical protein
MNLVLSEAPMVPALRRFASLSALTGWALSTTVSSAEDAADD